MKSEDHLMVGWERWWSGHKGRCWGVDSALTVRGVRSWPRVVLAGVGVLLVMAACGGGSSPTPVASGAEQGLSQQWQSIFDQVGADGTVSTDTALQAFSLTFGALPGVSVPAGDAGVIGDGTFAVRWLVAHWADISAQQRSAAIGLLPDLAGLGGAASTPAAHLAALPAMVLVSGQHSDAFYTQLAQQEATDIAAKLGKPLTLTVTAKLGQPQDAKDLAEAMPLDSNGEQQGKPARCAITVSASGDGLAGDDLSQTMAHEVWHCFEAQYGGFGKFFNAKAYSWIVEGEAEWVGDTLYPNALNVAAKFWFRYLDHPDKPLFSRAYDAVGFYSQLGQSGVDVWSKLLPILTAPDNPTAFDLAGGHRDEFLDLWAAGLARTPGRGDAWDVTGPAIPAEIPAPQAFTIGDGASQPLSVKAYTNAWYGPAVSTDVITVTISGHARVSDETGKDYLVQGQSTYCHTTTGCDCPNQTTAVPMLALTGNDIFLAVTGGSTDTTGIVTGQSLQTYCTKKTTTKACELVTQQEASALVGVAFGPGRTILASSVTNGCLYSDPAQNHVFMVDLFVAGTDQLHKLRDQAVAELTQSTQDNPEGSQFNQQPVTGVGAEATVLTLHTPAATGSSGISIRENNARGLFVITNGYGLYLLDQAHGGALPPPTGALVAQATVALSRLP